MSTDQIPAATLAESLKAVSEATLKKAPAAHIAKIVRRVVDHEGLTPQLNVAAFNSSI
jgi:hypothetical protein